MAYYSQIGTVDQFINFLHNW